MSTIKKEKAPKAPKLKREKKLTEDGNYVRNSELLPVVIEAKRLGHVTDELVRMIQKIATRYSLKYNFVGYSYREDMVSVAVMNLCNNALKFDPEKSSNPFSFYTTAIYHSFLQYMAYEKNHRNIRDALIVDAGSNPSFNFMQGEKDEHHFEFSDSDNIGINDSFHREDDGEEKKDVHEHDVVKSKIKDRSHGVIIQYKVSDYIIDPVTNEMTLKPDAVGVEVPYQPKVEAPPPPKRNPFAKKKVAPVEADLSIEDGFPELPAELVGDGYGETDSFNELNND